MLRRLRIVRDLAALGVMTLRARDPWPEEIGGPKRRAAAFVGVCIAFAWTLGFFYDRW